MKDIIWDGDERMIPGHGYGTKGAELNLPDSLADSLVNQGLAHYKKEASVKKPMLNKDKLED